MWSQGTETITLIFLGATATNSSSHTSVQRHPGFRQDQEESPIVQHTAYRSGVNFPVNILVEDGRVTLGN